MSPLMNSVEEMEAEARRFWVACRLHERPVEEAASMLAQKVPSLNPRSIPSLIASWKKSHLELCSSADAQWGLSELIYSFERHKVRLQMIDTLFDKVFSANDKIGVVEASRRESDAGLALVKLVLNQRAAIGELSEDEHVQKLAHEHIAELAHLARAIEPSEKERKAMEIMERTIRHADG